MNSPEKNKRKVTYRYGLASATSRLLSRFFDLLVIFLLLIGVYWWIFHDVMIVDSNAGDSTSLFPAWKIFVFTLVSAIFFFLYFVILPFFWNGFTLFSKLFKIRIYSVLLKTLLLDKKWYQRINFVFLKQLLIRELFTWEINLILFVILGICAFFYTDDINSWIQILLSSSSSLAIESSNLVAILFFAFFSVSGMISFLIILNVIFTSKKRSFHDTISNTVVIKMTDVHSDEKKFDYNQKKRTKIQFSFPGEIPPDSIIDIAEGK